MIAAGTRLGPYEIVSPLGAGGMGEVYRARDTRLHREVAVKVLPASFSQDADRLRRFEQEARAASALNHPNILTIHDVGSYDCAPYVVSELLEGATLREKLGAGPLPVRKATESAVQIAQGLSAAHSKGIVHRDLKPENLFVTSDGRIKILDFGLAKLSGWETASDQGTEAPTQAAATEPGVVLGTVGYMSPEQVRGLPADHRSDVFALGAVLYEMVTGRRAFQSGSKVETLNAILKEDPSDVSIARPDAPAALERVIRRCLEKNPEERFQSARDVAYALEETLAGSAAARATAAAPLSRPRPAYRQIALAFVIVAALAALIAFDVGGIRRRLTGGTSPQSIRSLAVLPLENLSRDPEQEYFADGMTEALISNLARIRSLKVISRTSVMRYKGTRKAVPEIARELDVDGIVEGSVLRSGNRVRITAQLVDASSDQHLWAEDYERDLQDVLTLQGEVARAIAEQVRAAVTPQEEAALAKTRRIDPEAHRLYLLGRFQWNKRSREGFEKAREYFQQAIEKDPSYALTHAGIADVYIVFRSYHLMEPEEAGRRSKAAALKALELDASLAEAHASLASVHWDDLDWADAYRRAIELNPGYATARQWYGEFLSQRGRPEQAIRELQTAEKFDPLSLIIRSSLGTVYYQARQYDRAVEQQRKTLEDEPGFERAHSYLGQVFVQKKMFAEAIASLERARALSDSSQVLATLGYAYGVAGRRSEALGMLERLDQISKRAYVSPLDVAIVHIGLGDRDRAFEWLGKAVAKRASNVADINVDPIFDPLRSDPRFRDLLLRIGLAP